MNYYSDFIRGRSGIAAPLTDLLQDKHPEPIIWTLESSLAFQKLKRAIAEAPVLAPPNFDLPFKVQTDASDRGVGAILSQTDKDSEHPYFYSKKLLDRERRYSTTEKELLAIVLSCKKFYTYLVGRHFIIKTDHRPLQFIMKKDPTTGRMARWLDALRELDFTIEYRRGKLYGNADALSRQLWPTAQDAEEVEGGVRPAQQPWQDKGQDKITLQKMLLEPIDRRSLTPDPFTLHSQTYEHYHAKLLPFPL